MGFLAQWIQWVNQVTWNLKPRLWYSTTRIFLALFVLIHGVLAPVSLPLSSRAFAQISKQVVRANASLPSGPEYQDCTFILINTPIYAFFVRDLLGHRMLQGQSTSIRSITAGNHTLILKHKDVHTLEVRALNGSLTDQDAFFLGKANISICQGKKVELDDVNIEVLEVNDGLPSAARFRFSVPLEDANLVWFRWQNGEYVPFRLPSMDETITVEGARFTMG